MASDIYIYSCKQLQNWTYLYNSSTSIWVCKDMDVVFRLLQPVSSAEGTRVGRSATAAAASLEETCPAGGGKSAGPTAENSPGYEEVKAMEEC